MQVGAVQDPADGRFLKLWIEPAGLCQNSKPRNWLQFTSPAGSGLLTGGRRFAPASLLLLRPLLMATGLRASKLTL